MNVENDSEKNINEKITENKKTLSEQLSEGNSQAEKKQEDLQSDAVQQNNDNAQGQQSSQPDNDNQQSQNKQFLPISAMDYEDKIKSILGDCLDIVIDRFTTRHKEIVIVYVDGLTDKDLIDRDIIMPLKSQQFDGNIDLSIRAAFKKIYDQDLIIKNILEGNAIVYYADASYAISIDFKKWDKRAVDVPEAEGVTIGPKEGFTENLQTNLSLIRRKLKTPNLYVEDMVLGRQTNTRIAIIYLKDIVNKSVLKELKKRLESIDVDSILETGQIEQFIEENPFSIISGIGITQKPDVAAARMLEGRVIIICDGTPHALTIPELFVETLHKSEDYYIRTLYANFIRFLRLFAITIGILLPGFALAVLTYSQEMLPYTFLISFIQSTEGTPLPEAAELMFLGISFELLKEAGLRMPKAVGSAITIVGALIIGDVAVSAGIVGAPSVIIIAMTAVASLLVVDLNEFVTIYRFVFILLGAVMGVVGISAGVFFLLIQLISTKSFGIPVLSSFSKKELKDSILRFPLKKLNFRPISVAKNNRKRYGDNIND